MLRDECLLCRTYGALRFLLSFSQPLQAELTSQRAYGAGLAVHRPCRRPLVPFFLAPQARGPRHALRVTGWRYTRRIPLTIATVPCKYYNDTFPARGECILAPFAFGEAAKARKRYFVNVRQPRKEDEKNDSNLPPVGPGLGRVCGLLSGDDHR